MTDSDPSLDDSIALAFDHSALLTDRKDELKSNKIYEGNPLWLGANFSFSSLDYNIYCSLSLDFSL